MVWSDIGQDMSFDQNKKAIFYQKSKFDYLSPRLLKHLCKPLSTIVINALQQIQSGAVNKYCSSPLTNTIQSCQQIPFIYCMKYNPRSATKKINCSDLITCPSTLSVMMPPSSATMESTTRRRNSLRTNLF